MIFRKKLERFVRVVISLLIQIKKHKILSKKFANKWIKFLKMLMKLKNRTSKSLSKYRELTTFFQTIFSNRLIEQDYDNISRILDCIRNEFYSQRCEKNEYDFFWSFFKRYESRCFLWLLSSSRNQSIYRISKKKLLNIKCMYHNFINLVVFNFFNNIDFWFRVKSLETTRFDLINWDASKLSWLIV